MWAKIKTSQEKMVAAITSIQYQLENTIRTRVEDILASVDQWAWGLC
jgi:hypothetical protein